MTSCRAGTWPTRRRRRVRSEPVRRCSIRARAGLRVAIAGDYFRRGGRPECFAAVDHVAAAFGATREVVLPEAGAARAAAFVITAAEGAAFHLARLRNDRRISTPRCATGCSPVR